MDTQQIRRVNLRKLVSEYDGMNSLARALGLARGAYISQLLSEPATRTISEKTARAWEEKLGKPKGWMDGVADTTAARPAVDAALLAQTIAAVDGALKGAKVSLAPAQFADLVALGYTDAISSGRVDANRIGMIVSLIRR